MTAVERFGSMGAKAQNSQRAKTVTNNSLENEHSIREIEREREPERTREGESHLQRETKIGMEKMSAVI